MHKSLRNPIRGKPPLSQSVRQLGRRQNYSLRRELYTWVISESSELPLIFVLPRPIKELGVQRGAVHWHQSFSAHLSFSGWSITLRGRPHQYPDD